MPPCVAAFARGNLALSLKGVWWADLALIPCWLLMLWFKRFKHDELAQLVGVSAVAFAVRGMGMHARELFCLLRAFV